MGRVAKILLGTGTAAILLIAPVPSYQYWQKARLRARQERIRTAEAECARLAELHDFEGLDTALSGDLPSHSCRRIIAFGFACPDGREYLLRKIADADLPKERRLSYVRLLSGGGPEYHAVFRDIDRGGARIEITSGEGNGDFLTRVARIASDSRGDEELCLALLDELGSLARGAGFQPSEAVQADRAAAVEPLRALHASGSDRIKYKAEEAAAELDRAGYDSLRPKCGPILSELRPAVSEQYGTPRGRVLRYEYLIRHLGDEPITSAELVAVSETGKEFLLTPPVFSPRSRSEGGMRSVPVSENVPPGRYRVFLRFTRDGRVVSEGYGFETEL